MKRQIVFIILWLLSCLSYAETGYMLLPITDIYDGDTIKTVISESRLPYPLNHLEVRVYGIDSPEMPALSYIETGKLGRAQCIKEAELAIVAKEALVTLKGNSMTMKVTNMKWDKYGGRILGDVKINGVDIAVHLIELGYAVPYFGIGEKKNWCL